MNAVELTADALAQLLVNGIITRPHRMEATAALGLVHDDVAAALDRHRASGYQLPRPATDPVPITTVGRLTRKETIAAYERILEVLREHGGRIEDERGWLNKRMRDLTGLPVSAQTFSSWLKHLDDRGHIRRDVRGRLTYSAELVTDDEPDTTKETP